MNGVSTLHPPRQGPLGGLLRHAVDEPLPADFPTPKLRGVRELVLERDGRTCRICNTHQVFVPGEAEASAHLASLGLGLMSQDMPEFTLVRACPDCADEVADASERPSDRRSRVLGQLCRLLYLKNCEMAGVQPVGGARS